MYFPFSSWQVFEYPLHLLDYPKKMLSRLIDVQVNDEIVVCSYVPNVLCVWNLKTKELVHTICSLLFYNYEGN